MRPDPSIARLFCGLALLSIVFLVVERLLGRGRGRPVLRRGFLTDATYWILTPLVTKPLIRLVIVLPIGLLVACGAVSAEEWRSRDYAGFGPLSRQPLWLQTIEIYLLVDFLAYWSHRLFHGGLWWPFHAVHHSSEELDWMSSIRVHPVNEFVGTFCRATPVLLLGLNPLVTASTAPVLTLFAVLLHANVDWDFGPLRGVIASPVFHRWHHSRDPAAIDRNFAGLFPVWDILFGTYYMPRDRSPENFGIHTPMPEGYVSQLVHPFVAQTFRRPPRGRRVVHTACMLTLVATLIADSGVAQTPPAGAAARGQASKWKGTAVSTGAPLPPANRFKPRSHGPEVGGAGLQADVIARLDVEMQRHVAARNVAGISAIIHKDGVRGYFETFGMADIERGRALDKDAIFRLMSMTKPVIALAALSLHDDGRFALDEPIAKYCPEWVSPLVKEGDALVPAMCGITPRMLMSHSSGLGYGGGQAAAALAYEAMTKPGATLNDFSAAVAKEPLLFQPGTNYNYGLGLDILGRYLEALTGQSLDVILRERLFGPLGMPDTDFHVPAAKLGRLCQIYGQPGPGVLVPGTDLVTVTSKPTLCLGGHGLFGTIRDYERLCRMILGRGELDGVRVLKPETVDLIFENHLAHPTMKYGLGGIVNGAGSYGWGGADGTQFVIDRGNASFTLFMVQTQHYKAPTYPAFLALANEACGLTAAGAVAGRSGTPAGAGTTGGFAERDTNKDGKLDRHELPAALIDRLDADHDGFVTERELQTLWRK